MWSAGSAEPRYHVFFLLPEGNGRYPAHEGVGSDALQVEQGPVEKQQQDDVLAEAEAPPTLPDDGDVLETLETQTAKQKCHRPLVPSERLISQHLLQSPVLPDCLTQASSLLSDCMSKVVSFT